LSLQIIKGTSGPSTSEQILELILAHPQGISVREICQTLNRPVSMVQICLNNLKSSKLIRRKKSLSGNYWLYYYRWQNSHRHKS
jgi:DNA-binding IclR family transcriptional regulator